MLQMSNAKWSPQMARRSHGVAFGDLAKLRRTGLKAISLRPHALDCSGYANPHEQEVVKPENGSGLASLPLRSRSAARVFRQCSCEQGLDHSLPADIEPGRPLIELPKHALGQIDIHAADGSADCEPVSEVCGNISVSTDEFSLGGEQSGHIVLPTLSTTGDGILTGLRVMSP